jgi:hypothetical protein
MGCAPSGAGRRSRAAPAEVHPQLPHSLEELSQPNARAIAPEFRLSGNPTADFDIYGYWTSTSQIDRPTQVFQVDFFDGVIRTKFRVPDSSDSSGIKLRVRAVRG